MRFHGPFGTSVWLMNFQYVTSFSASPRHVQSAGETSSPARAPKVFLGIVELPNTYPKSSSSLGPVSSHCPKQTLPLYSISTHRFLRYDSPIGNGIYQGICSTLFLKLSSAE